MRGGEKDEDDQRRIEWREKDEDDERRKGIIYGLKKDREGN